MKEPEAHIVPHKTFLLVWLALLALTAITVTVAELHLGRFSMLTALAIASLKAGLVLWFFMHLKYESRLFKWLLLAPIVTLAVIIGLTFFDIWYR
ncbi:MAG: cytochrome-c oxidase [Nitrospirae bacterium]|nr:cytochrome-c oxidase [Nitrospirota bacterium]